MNSNVKTAVRTLEAFEAFGRAQKPLTLSELARAIRAPVSSCHGLVTTLRNRGYVYSVGANRQVYPTRRILDVAEAIVRNDPLLETAAPVLARLRDDTGETVILGGLEPDAVVYLEVIEGLHTIRYTAKPGELKPLHSSAIGKAMLASLGAEELTKILSRLSLGRITDATITTEKALRSDLEEGRGRGLFVTRGENVADVMGMAVPTTLAGQPLAVALAGPIGRMEEAFNVHAKRLKAAAAELLRLGGGR